MSQQDSLGFIKMFISIIYTRTQQHSLIQSSKYAQYEYTVRRVLQ